MIKNIKVKENGIDKSHKLWPECEKIIKELHGEEYDKICPLKPYKLSFELKDLPVCYANAIRRCAIDEVEHLCLTFNDYNSDDGYNSLEYIKLRIRTIHVNQDLPNKGKNISFSLHVQNTTTRLKTIWTNDLIPNKPLMIPAFNKGVEICTLLPSKRIDINNIYIESAKGRSDAVHTLFYQCGIVSLDLPSKERPNPKMEDFDYEVQKAAAMSHYKVNSSVSYSTHNLLTFNNVAINEKVVLNSMQLVLDKLKSRFNRLKNLTKSTINFSTVNEKDAIKIRFMVENETHTVAKILYDEIFKFHKVKNVSFRCIQHEKNIVLNVELIENKNPRKWLLEVIEDISKKLEKLNVL